MGTLTSLAGRGPACRSVMHRRSGLRVLMTGRDPRATSALSDSVAPRRSNPAASRAPIRLEGRNPSGLLQSLGITPSKWSREVVGPSGQTRSDHGPRAAGSAPFRHCLGFVRLDWGQMSRLGKPPASRMPACSGDRMRVAETVGESNVSKAAPWTESRLERDTGRNGPAVSRHVH